MAPTEPAILTIFPTSEQRRPFRKWAGRRGIATLPGNGFSVPSAMLPEIPIELILGARVNGEIYLPAPGQVHYDAPPLEPDVDPLEAALTDHELTDDELDVIAGFPPPPADDIPTTGAPTFDLDDSP